MTPKHTSLLFILFILLTCCSPKSAPYESGPVMNTKNIKKTFEPILQFMDYQPGMTFADVGAGSGVLTIMMTSLMDQSDIYIQEIDTAILKKSNIDKALNFYSKQNGQELQQKNKYHLIIGNVKQTNLPDDKFDLIFSNATVHNFISIDSMMTDIGKKLKPSGQLYFRDSFKGDHGEGAYCSDKKCARPLLVIDVFPYRYAAAQFHAHKEIPT